MGKWLNLKPSDPFEEHSKLYEEAVGKWDPKKGPCPAWVPGKEASETQVFRFIKEAGFRDYSELHRFSWEKPSEFWGKVIEKLEIHFSASPKEILNLSKGAAHPEWLSGAKLNIARSCFRADGGDIAIVSQKEGEAPKKMTYGELNELSSRVAGSLSARGFKKGDAIAIDMTMTPECVAIYLGILKAGCAVISIADSFAPAEIATRLRIGEAKAIFTQDGIRRGGKVLPLYSKVIEAGAPMAIVMKDAGEGVELRPKDLDWESFLGSSGFDPVDCDPHDAINILFSSGTTGDPKAIPWNHTTAIKAASDAYFHSDVGPGSVVCWPTSIGWMMGPWLIFATLINRGTIALYEGLPTSRGFCEFVEKAGVQMLGVVPSLVKAWKTSDAVSGLDWSLDWTKIRCFASTGECSNPKDMLWLMSRAPGYRPVIEYCGGTEIGGGYVTSTLIHPNAPSTFATQAMGLRFFVLDEKGDESEQGEVFIAPPSMGLSLSLLNRDHDEVYYKGAPAGPGGEILRRHGDEIECLEGGYFRAHGRVDDTMNLGGIKVSSVELERTMNRVEEVKETAAIAVTPKGGGPSELVVFAVLEGKEPKDDRDGLKDRLQRIIKSELNPLFKIKDLVVKDSLPRTASNKVMRRVLRGEYSS